MGPAFRLPLPDPDRLRGGDPGAAGQADRPPLRLGPDARRGPGAEPAAGDRRALRHIRPAGRRDLRQVLSAAERHQPLLLRGLPHPHLGEAAPAARVLCGQDARRRYHRPHDGRRQRHGGQRQRRCGYPDLGLSADHRHRSDPLFHRLAHGHPRGPALSAVRLPLRQDGDARGRALGQALRPRRQADLPRGGSFHELSHDQGFQPGGGSAEAL